MKKVKFAAQIFILAAAFPVLFISGISYSGKKSNDEKEEKVSPEIQKDIQKSEESPVCKHECMDSKTACPFQQN